MIVGFGSAPVQLGDMLVAPLGPILSAVQNLGQHVLQSIGIKRPFILGKLRGPEAFAFLRAVNTGHPGSMTTIHADGVDGAVEQLVLFVLEGGWTLRRADIVDYIRASIGVMVQLERSASGRKVAEVRVRG